MGAQFDKKIVKIRELCAANRIDYQDLYNLQAHLAKESLIVITILPYNVRTYGRYGRSDTFGYWISDIRHKKWGYTQKNNQYEYKTYDECLATALIEALKRILK